MFLHCDEDLDSFFLLAVSNWNEINERTGASHLWSLGVRRCEESSHVLAAHETLVLEILFCKYFFFICGFDFFPKISGQTEFLSILSILRIFLVVFIILSELFSSMFDWVWMWFFFVSFCCAIKTCLTSTSCLSLSYQHLVLLFGPA